LTFAAPLLAAARHFGQHCKGVSDEFMICRFDKKDPEKCAELGKKVTQCGIELYVAVFPPTDSDVRYCTFLFPFRYSAPFRLRDATLSRIPKVASVMEVAVHLIC
jgi:hypothetical protein